jgi:excisionase family DNA binding protein
VSDKNDDFLSFEKALRELKLRSEELKKLVSEGEIRAYRDGDSMKFRREDVQSLGSKSEGDSKLSFADSLEDDTGMVTEQISDEDTLLADEDEVEAVTSRPSRVTRAPRAAAAAASATESKEPGWVTAAAIVGFALMLWGVLITYNVASQSDPKDSVFTSAFAERR